MCIYEHTYCPKGTTRWQQHLLEVFQGISPHIWKVSLVPADQWGVLGISLTLDSPPTLISTFLKKHDLVNENVQTFRHMYTEPNRSLYTNFCITPTKRHCIYEYSNANKFISYTYIPRSREQGVSRRHSCVYLFLHAFVDALKTHLFTCTHTLLLFLSSSL